MEARSNTILYNNIADTRIAYDDGKDGFGSPNCGCWQFTTMPRQRDSRWRMENGGDSRHITQLQMTSGSRQQP